MYEFHSMQEANFAENITACVQEKNKLLKL